MFDESCERKKNNIRNYRFTRGDTFTLNITYESVQGRPPVKKPINITGATILMTVKNNPTDPDPGMFQLSVGSGIIITDALNGKFSITIPTADSMSLNCNRAYAFDVVIKLNGNRDTVLNGTINVKQNVTAS